jgi:hypothetical protein
MQILNLYLDVDKPGGAACLLAGTGSQAKQGNQGLIAGDTLTLRLYFRQVAGLGSASTAVDLDTGSAIVLAGKAVLTEADALFSASSFTFNGTGHYYEATLDLNTTGLDTLLATATSATVYCDVEVQNATNTKRITYRFTATVYKEAYTGSEGTTSGNPPYPAPENVAVKNPTGNMHREKDGKWQLKDVAAGDWHDFWLENGVLQFGPGEA